MIGNWTEVTLQAIADIIPGFAFKGTDFGDLGELVIKIKDISPPIIDTSAAKRVELKKYAGKSFAKYQIQKGDFAMAMTGATIGKIGRCNSRIVAYINQRVAKISPKKSVDRDFVYHALQVPEFEQFIQNNIDSHSAQENISGNSLGRFPILLPNKLSEQRAIASVLSSLDDKIDLLHRQNKTLEAMAETLFRQWFVETTCNSWAIQPLSGIADFLNGLACQKYPPSCPSDCLPVLKIKELTSGISESSDVASANVKPEYVINGGDVIFSWSATLLVKIWDGPTCVLNQHLFKVTSAEFPKWFFYLWCKHHLEEFKAISSAHATTMGHIKRSDLDEAMVRIPPNLELRKMNAVIAPIIEKIESNNRQL